MPLGTLRPLLPTSVTEPLLAQDMTRIPKLPTIIESLLPDSVTAFPWFTSKVTGDVLHGGDHQGAVLSTTGTLPKGPLAGPPEGDCWPRAAKEAPPVTTKFVPGVNEFKGAARIRFPPPLAVMVWAVPLSDNVPHKHRLTPVSTLKLGDPPSVVASKGQAHSVAGHDVQLVAADRQAAHGYVTVGADRRVGRQQHRVAVGNRGNRCGELAVGNVVALPVESE